MFMVGGGILVHGIPPLHHLVEAIGHAAHDVPGVGGVLGMLVPSVLQALAGVVAGGLVLAVVSAFKRLRTKAG